MGADLGQIVAEEGEGGEVEQTLEVCGGVRGAGTRENPRPERRR